MIENLSFIVIDFEWCVNGGAPSDSINFDNFKVNKCRQFDSSQLICFFIALIEAKWCTDIYKLLNSWRNRNQLKI